MKLWFVQERRPLQGRDRKVWIVRHVAMAETDELAVALVKSENPAAARNIGSVWSAYECDGPPCVTIGFVSDEATFEEKKARKGLYR